MSIDLTQFHATYFEESFELLENMESMLLAMESGPTDPESIHDVFRAAHSIKGGAGTFGFAAIAEFTHVVEAILDEVRNGERLVTPDVVEPLLGSVDCVRRMLTAVRDAEEIDPAPVSEVRGQLESILSKDTVPSESNDQAPTEQGPDLWTIEFKPHLDLLRTGNDPLRLLGELARLGPMEAECHIDSLPDFDDLDPEETHLSWSIQLGGNVSRSEIDDVFDWVNDQCDLEIWGACEVPPTDSQPSSIDTPTPKSPPKVVAEAPVAVSPEAGPKRAPSKNAGVQSIRVGIDKIDDLINMVGELVITQSMLQEIGENYEEMNLEQLRDKLALLGRNTRELQESVMRIRMLPISFAFNRFPRLVHDISRKLDKKVELQLSGEQTELDKTVMEKISDPLTHLVRNALDHGIESPGARLAAGKPELGSIAMTAYHESGSIVIEIRDDGAGINKSKVLARAREKGLVLPEESLSDEAINNLIFQPGFSTAETVSDLSGRGVGMDVVRKNISSIGGSINLHSEEGHGSTVSIRLPLTLSILDGQTVRVGAENFILPLACILESVQVRAQEISRLGGKTEVFKLRDEFLPVVRLHRIFDLAPGSTDLTDGLIVVVDSDRRRVGLFVDELLGQQQVVIKSLETNFRKVDGISGATILGDGTVALILDVLGLVRLHREHGERRDREPSGEENVEHAA